MSSQRKVGGAVLAAVLAVVFGFASPAAAATYAGYAMAYFTESPNMSAANYGLHIAVSSDGLNWTPINQNNPVVTPTAGALGLRDPYILRKQDGTFEVLATDLKGTDWSYNSQYIHVWDSTDLRSFTNYRRLKVNSLATHSWAPEAFWDAGRNQYGVIYSSVVGGHNVIMVSYTTDFRTATEGTVFFDNGTDVIDGNLVSQGGVNYFYYRGTGGLFGAKSSTLNPGSFTTYTSVINPGRGVEAPQLAPALSGNGYTLWGDTYSPNGRFFAWSTSSLSTGSWTLLNDRTYTQPLNSKHLGITPLTATELSNLLATGTPTWNRVKSYNYPGRYIRHYNNVGRIDEYPFDQWQDQQWKLVPGLADSAGVSFQSVNYPTMYLRHYNYAIQLATSDGTTAFKGDATFYKVAGLADSSWTSFRSYNYSDRYLRHSNYVLRIDPISTATEKQDATFKVGF
ncbi:hypothetical protein BJ973_008891 [Actinoplanes tereljensis]|uniref:Alpha-L-arabinofuranosidase B arabinose-binding domain-containing protein n=1 Tax=Paractinoplanes tereljensis TaxID=571912 RepID=A0A919NHL3_9ACTN|nr:glycoside hydrolase family 43 protein [Actinoplanes tereljensis]GIF18146.1 hypothetical protein Ate02nite_08760 [Actinoplanes tereljensis]